MTQPLSQLVSRVLLPRVEQPAQYIGGEVNARTKVHTPETLTVALAFPDTYPIGMSHLGLSILYTALNDMPAVAAERVFCPALDAAAIMREHDIPLFSWESRRPVRDVDILGITLQHELAYSNILYLLELAGIPFHATERTTEHPLVIAGGGMADCCEPVAEFFDAVILGDGEESLPALVEQLRQLKQSGIDDRVEQLRRLARQFPFFYVPRFYRPTFSTTGDSITDRLVNLEPTEEGIPPLIERAEVTDLDQAPFPTAPVVAHAETVHDRVAIEIMRGCPQRCLFCHAGHTRGRVRTRSIETILDIAEQSIGNTGHDTIALLSLSSSDYPQLGTLAGRLYDRFAHRHIGLSLPSLRVDHQLRDIPEQINNVRKEGLTVAVEAAAPRIRQAIGKTLTEQQLTDTMLAAYRAGWRKVKLYFMVGFPGETKQDILGIVELAHRIAMLRKEVAPGPATVNATVSWLVPKPHTPFAWMAQQSPDYFQRAQAMLIDAKKQLRGSPIKLRFHGIEQSLLEAAFARGDRRLGRVIEHAWRNGACFDEWHETFNYQRWVEAFHACGVTIEQFANREHAPDEHLPWQHLAGTNTQTLYRRYQRYLTATAEKSPR